MTRQNITRGYSEYDLTPVQELNGLLFKRDDLYAPMGSGGVNGGKMRQCVMLVEHAQATKIGLKRILSYCSIYSPQAPITSATAKLKGLESTILYGGTTPERIKKLDMPRLALYYGADIKIATKSGRHNVLHARAKELTDEDTFIVQYGINLDEYGNVLLGAVAEQVRNIPDKLENLIVTCGSGISASGIMIGLKLYNKNVKNIHLVATAPSRIKSIHERLIEHDADRDFHYHDLFNSKGFLYEKGIEVAYQGIKLHPNYEAKVMKWFIQSGISKENTLFWIVGAEPKKV